MSEYEPITGELRGKMDTLGWYDEDGNIVFTTGGTPVSEIACLAISSKTFDRLCDAIDAVHAGLERENAELRQRVEELGNGDDSMHYGWRITDELMAWWVRKFPVMDKELHKDFTAIADRIDAKHQKAEDEWKAKHGQMWLKGYGECHAELLEGNETLAADLESCGWVRLPKDADGNWHPCYYPMEEVVPKLERGLRELREHPERYRQYEPENGWGTLPGAIKCIESWLYELDGNNNWDAVTNEWPIEALWWRW